MGIGLNFIEVAIPWNDVVHGAAKFAKNVGN
jgi:hypothetical protein